MLMIEIDEDLLADWKASAKLCKSNTPTDKLGASAAASCKSQGYRARSGKKSHLVGKSRITLDGRKIKGAAYGGPLPDYSGTA